MLGVEGSWKKYLLCESLGLVVFKANKSRRFNGLQGENGLQLP